MNSQTQQPAQAPVKKPNNSAVIIIAVVLGALIIMGVGGYFAWKYFIKAKISTSADTTTTKNTSAFTLSQLEEMLKYPGSTVKSTDRTKASGFTSVMEMETADSVITANNYYLSLKSNDKWTVSSKSLESDNSRADITYASTTGNFTVAFVIDHAYDNTAILVRIDAENLPVGTPLSTTTTTTPTTTTTKASTDTSKATISTDYVIADSDTRVITESELTSLTPWQLKVARNEIYARHGREFVHKDLQCYFGGKSWYEINPSFTESLLTTTDTKNVATIQAYETKISSPLASTDSGC